MKRKESGSTKAAAPKKKDQQQSIAASFKTASFKQIKTQDGPSCIGKSFQVPGSFWKEQCDEDEVVRILRQSRAPR